MSALMLLFGFPVVAPALALYGAGNGIGAVARGTVPLALFGAERYPVLMGRLGFRLPVASVALSRRGRLPEELSGRDTAALDRTRGHECRSCGSAADGCAVLAELSALVILGLGLSS